MERDFQNSNNRTEQLYQENRQLQEKISVLENQLRQTESMIKNKDEEKKKELEIMKDFF